VDITQLILDDHFEQRRLFAMIEQADGAGPGVLGVMWERLSAFLEVHAQAEEEFFYPQLLRIGLITGRLRNTEDETLDAISDHNEIRDTIADVAGHDVGSPGWHAAVAAVNKANGEHMAEEEREGLTDFRRAAALQLRHELALAFAAFEARHFAGVRPVDKDPAAYVRHAEEAARASAGSGTLAIGALKDLDPGY
jgi:Hemerythrin HHE cation binding domain